MITVADFLYKLTYAGVPFVADRARVFRIDYSNPARARPSDLPTKHQPLADLVDELNRLLPFHYLTDFAPNSDYPGRNIGHLARRYITDPLNTQTVKIGEWFYPTGASRWSVFRMLATSSQVKEMMRLTSCSTKADLVMKAVPYGLNEANYTVTSKMHMLPPRPLGEHGVKFDGLYLVTLVDERYYWQFASVSLRPNKSTTWATLIEQIGDVLGFPATNLADVAQQQQVEPDSQFWTNEDNAAILLDAVALNIGSVFLRKLAGTYNFYTPLYSRGVAYTNRSRAMTIGRTAGGDLFASGNRTVAGNLNAARNAVLPTQVAVTFPKYVVGNDPVPHYLNPRYQNQRPTCWFEDSYGDICTISVPLLSGALQFSGFPGIFVSGSQQLDNNGNPYISSGLVGTSGVTHTVHTTAKALYSGEAQGLANPINISGLTSLAMQLAQDYYQYQVSVALDESYPGTYAWDMEGVHDIIWTYSERTRQATTRAIRAPWNATVNELQPAAAALSGSTNIPPGVGGPSVAQAWRDSFSGTISTTLAATLTSGAYSVSIASPGYLPTQNRWKGQVENEKILFEGTSGGTNVNVVLRGIDGTLQSEHANGSTVTFLTPDVTYGVNLVTAEKMQWVFPSDTTSGGIQGVNFVPQTQTVYAFSASGKVMNSIVHYSGRLETYDTTLSSGYQLVARELVWIVNRNQTTEDGIRSGKRYDGQFAGFSPDGPPTAPLYLINSRRVVVDVTCDDDGLHVTYGYT